MSNKLLKTFCAAWLGLTYAACGSTDQQVGADDLMTTAAEKDGTDIQQALSSVGNAHVLGTNEKDGVPYYVTGNFGVAKTSAIGLAPVDAKATVQDALTVGAPIFRMRPEDLAFKTMTNDKAGQHLRFQQMKNGLPVVNGEMIVHVDPKGNVFAINGDARDAQSGMTQSTLVKPQIAADAAALLASNATDAKDKSAKAERLVYVRDSSDQIVLAHEVRVTGQEADGLPVNTLVYVDAKSGRIALVAPQIHTALSRKVYSANNTTTQPGTLKRSEGQAAVGDVSVDGNYDALGATYNCYKTNFNRDSFDNAGATYISTVHYDVNYVNAYWDGTQMVYGDGDGVDASTLAVDKDVTTHELTHAVTERTSNLTYSGQSGGLNESMSDTFGAICQSWENAWSTAAAIWMVGETCWTPGTPNDALRYMDDPAKDGGSLDWAPDEAGQDVHYSSGPPNLVFALLSKGGSHPRGKSSIVVTGIGVQKAGQIWYLANTSIFTSSTDYEHAKTYTEQAATQLYGAGTQEVASVTAAWQAVGVGIPPPPPTDLSNGVPVTGLSGSTGAKKYYRLTVPANQGSLSFTISGGTGDADMYVKYGASPTTSTYDCRPYVSGNSESCPFTSPAGGDWYVMINGYSTYSGVTLTGTYSAGGGGGGGGTALTNGVATAPYNGAASSMTCFTLAVPTGKTKLTFNQAGASGNTGDADMYVKFGTQPTTTTYDCRPYTSGNTESCSFNAPSAGTWYACSRGYSAYTKVTMKGTYQ